jgi:hypothetical protein
VEVEPSESDDDKVSSEGNDDYEIELTKPLKDEVNNNVNT